MRRAIIYLCQKNISSAEYVKRCRIFMAFSNINFFCNDICAPFKVWSPNPFHTLKIRSADKRSPWNRCRCRHMFDRPAEILEITRKICPRGVQNRKSNKRACGAPIAFAWNCQAWKKGFDFDKSDSLWLDNLLAKCNQRNCANWFRRYPWNISAS